MGRSSADVLDVSTIKEAVNSIKEFYEEDPVSMCDLMSTFEIHGLTIKEVVTVYAKLMKFSDGDLLITIKDGKAAVIK